MGFLHTRRQPLASTIGGIELATENPLFAPAVAAATAAGWHTWFYPSPARAKFDPLVGPLLDTPTVVQDAYDPVTEYYFDSHAPSMVTSTPPRANFLDPAGHGGLASRQRFDSYDGANPLWWIIFAARINQLATTIVGNGVVVNTTADPDVMGDGMRFDGASGLRVYVGGTVMGSITEADPTNWHIYMCRLASPTLFRAYRDKSNKVSVSTSGAQISGGYLQIGGRGADGSTENLAGSVDIGWIWGGTGLLDITENRDVEDYFMDVYGVV